MLEQSIVAMITPISSCFMTSYMLYSYPYKILTNMCLYSKRVFPISSFEMTAKTIPLLPLSYRKKKTIALLLAPLPKTCYILLL